MPASARVSGGLVGSGTEVPPEDCAVDVARLRLGQLIVCRKCVTLSMQNDLCFYAPALDVEACFLDNPVKILRITR